MIVPPAGAGCNEPLRTVAALKQLTHSRVIKTMHNPVTHRDYWYTPATESLKRPTGGLVFFDVQIFERYVVTPEQCPNFSAVTTPGGAIQSDVTRHGWVVLYRSSNPIPD